MRLSSLNVAGRRLRCCTLLLYSGHLHLMELSADGPPRVRAGGLATVLSQLLTRVYTNPRGAPKLARAAGGQSELTGQ